MEANAFFMASQIKATKLRGQPAVAWKYLNSARAVKYLVALLPHHGLMHFCLNIVYVLK